MSLPPYQNVKAMQSNEKLSDKENTRHAYLAFLKAFLTWSASRISYLRLIVPSSVSDVTVRKALIDSAANFELSSNTAWFIFSNSNS